MTNSLLLHVGSPKTATTLVQRHFSRTDVLAANGVHYPGPGRNPNRFAHHGLGLMLLDCRDAEAAALLSKELAPRGTTLVSSESMTNCIATPRLLRSFQTFLGAMAAVVDEVRVLIFLREASSFFESMYLHNVKATGLKTSFDDYLRQREGWYAELFANLGKIERECPKIVVDARAFIARTYAEEWRDVLGFDPGLDTTQRVNPRLSLKTQSVLKEYDVFCERYGSPLERLDAIIAFSSADSPFEDDIYDFSPYRPGMAESIRQRALDEARRHHRAEYLEAFAEAPAKPAPAYAQIDFGQLTAHDLATADAFLRAARDSR